MPVPLVLLGAGVTASYLARRLRGVAGGRCCGCDDERGLCCVADAAVRDAGEWWGDAWVRMCGNVRF